MSFSYPAQSNQDIARDRKVKLINRFRFGRCYFGRNALVHGISKKDLKVTENDSIARGFEDWQNSMADKVTDYLCEDERILRGFEGVWLNTTV